MIFIQPEGWARPRGYSNGVIASGRMLSISGMVGWDTQERFQANDLVGQVRQALLNVVAVLEAAGGRPEHIVRMTWFLTDKQTYKDSAKEIGLIYREIIGRHYPAMSAIQVAGLIEDQALVEIEVTAMLPE